MASWFKGYKLRDAQEDMWLSLWRGAISEFCATLMFVFLGTGSVIATKAALGESAIHIPSLTVIALAHGFAIMILVYTVGDISGGHINPAVTWAVFITRRISALRAVTYVISQLLGAIIGSALLKSILPLSLQFGMGCHGINPLLTPAQGFWAETIFTFIFIFIVFATAVSPFAGKMSPLSTGDHGPGKLTPFAVGMTILVLHTVGIPLTGASMNPARSFGPAVVRGIWANHWVYWFGPLFGSTCAAAVTQLIFLQDPRTMVQVFKITRGQEQGVRRTPQTQRTAAAPQTTAQDNNFQMQVKKSDQSDENVRVQLEL